MLVLSPETPKAYKNPMEQKIYLQCFRATTPVPIKQRYHILKREFGKNALLAIPNYPSNPGFYPMHFEEKLLYK